MSDENKKEDSGIQADNNGIAIGGLNIGGDVNGIIQIGHTTGYTSEQVAILITQIQSTFQPKPFDGRCPYMGLDVFEEEDAELFFGREKLVDDLVSRVKDSRTVFITGPSGSGKSSLVRAGLIHALKQGGIKGSERWLYATMKPGRDPLESLATAFSRLKSPELGNYFRKNANQVNVLDECAESALTDNKNQRLVLFIDQFEEVFTQISKEKEEDRVAFLNLLTHAATVENGRMIILFSMRSDFVSNCATYPQLNALLNQQFVQIGAMQPDELVSAIAQPALRVGLHIDPDLIAQIINEMKGEPGALPLMQFALKDLFDSQQEKSGVPALILNDYLQRGGIHKALERHADDAFSKLSKNEQELTRSIFSILVKPGKDAAPDTRRTVLFNDLVPDNSNTEEIDTIVQKLASARLLTTDEQEGKDTVTISHEKLIDAWPWLNKLVNDNREVMALQGEIAADASEWDDHKKDASYLYSGARLMSVSEQIDTGKLVLLGTPHEFIETGKARQKRNRIILISGLSTIIALLVIAVIVFNQIATRALASEKKAIDNEKLARSRELASQSEDVRDENFPLSLLLGIESFQAKDSFQSRAALTGNMQSNPQLRTFLRAHTSSVTSVAFSPNGGILASGSSDNAIILWNVETGQTIGQPLRGHTGSVTSVAFSPDGKILASGSTDNTIILWDLEASQPVGHSFRWHTNDVTSIVFSPDGNILASGGLDSTIILWDIENSQIIGQPIRGHTNGIISIAFSPDGKTLASSDWDFTIIFWDIETQKSTGILSDNSVAYSIAFSPDGKILASGGGGDDIMLWDVLTSQPIGQPLAMHTESVTSVTFSPDGKLLASGSVDSSIILWDLATSQPVGQPLKGHIDSINCIAFSPDGNVLASGGTDSTGILWDMEVSQTFFHSLTAHTSEVNNVAFSPDGNMLASGSVDKSVIIWDVTTRQPIGHPLQGHTENVNSVAFSPNGKILASGSSDGTVILWDVITTRPIGQPLKMGDGNEGLITSVVFSPDGKKLAAASFNGPIIFWDVETRQTIGRPIVMQTKGEIHLAYSPDGNTLAYGNLDGNIILWDVAKYQGEFLKGPTSFITSVAFSPDGKMLASGSSDHTIVLWDIASRKPIGTPLTGHDYIVYSIAFSPDGKLLASGGQDNKIILWDLTSQRPITPLLTGPLNSWIFSVDFSPDGKTLASTGSGKTIILWDLNPQSWISRTCQRVGRNFYSAEWDKYFPNEEYRATCPSFPPSTESSRITSEQTISQILIAIYDGEIEKALDLLKQANQMQIQISVPDQKMIYSVIAESALSNTYDENRLKTALDKVREALALDDPSANLITESLNIVSVASGEQISTEVEAGDIDTAIDLFEQAKKMKITITINDINVLNNLCWHGSLQGYVEQSLQHCESAVKLAPDNWDIRDSRGLARALTSDYQGAILDFQYFMDHSDDSVLIEQRKHWIEQLKKGINPFTPEVLESLKSQ